MEARYLELVIGSDRVSGEEQGEPVAGAVLDTSERRLLMVVGIVTGVSLAVVVAVVLWLHAVPYDVSLVGADGRPESVRCSSLDAISISPADRVSVEAECSEAKTSRRNLGLLIGGTTITVVFAVSTWPSRRLTGEALGPNG